MALYPFILLREKSYIEDKVLINHELIHHRQELELLIIPFYILYLSHYLINRVKYKTHHQAYLNIIFEREAYANASDLNYLKKRRTFSFLKYAGFIN
ncbi:MAG: hypothetical protein H0W62_06425 [Chitinophagales bacterium]|nr:hypothetical protein [Chitinophagales bacterium]